MNDRGVQKTNSARRVYQILLSANKHGVGSSAPTTLSMWGAVLGGDLLLAPEGPGSPQYEDAVVPLLSELRRQIRWDFDQ